MKRFRYSLETVLDYKQQILDNEKAEHAVIIRRVDQKKEEIRRLKDELMGFHHGFDESKSVGAPIESFRLYDMCIGLMEEKINIRKEQLSHLKKEEEKKKQQVIAAKVDASKFEKLKGRRQEEYRKAEAKEEENFIEEFVTRGYTVGGLSSGE
ncbi:flagellar export protein FliJ [Otoolea muris]|uniref:flagellar export protein FliJ n=1 Tax=Otoolea muris TaxID=2941515 RepID=UPI00203C362C|nr:flagellar export protein FliJ [Otoolea muris]